MYDTRTYMYQGMYGGILGRISPSGKGAGDS